MKVGDKVKIEDNPSKETKFKDVLGKTGKIIKDYGDGDMKVT